MYMGKYATLRQKRDREVEEQWAAVMRFLRGQVGAIPDGSVHWFGTLQNHYCDVCGEELVGVGYCDSEAWYPNVTVTAQACPNCYREEEHK